MSTLSQLSISGVRSFDPDEEQLIKFDVPVTLLLGQNGCGKTTIIEALKYAITGKLPSGSNSGFVHDPRILHKPESQARIKLEIVDSLGKPVTVQKVFRVKARELKFNNLANKIIKDGETMTKTCEASNIEMCQSMGVSEAILNNVIFCHQEDSYWPLEEPKKLKERFDNIFNSEKYNNCIESLLKIKKQKTVYLSELGKDVKYYKEKKVQVDNKQKQLKEKNDRRKNIEIDIVNISKNLTVLENKMDKINKLKTDLTNAQTILKNFETQKECNLKQQTEILSSIGETDFTQAELESKISHFPSEMNEISNQLEQLKTNKLKLKEKQIDLKDKIAIQQQTLGHLQGEETQYNEKVQKQQTLINILLKKNNIHESANLNDKEKLDMLQNKKKQIENDIQELEKAKLDDEKQLQDDIETDKTKLIQLTHEISTKRSIISKLNLEKEELIKKLKILKTDDDWNINKIQNCLFEKQNSIECLKSKINISEVKLAIKKEEIENEEIECKLQKIDDEIKSVQSYCLTQNEINLKRNNLLEKQRYTSKIFNDIKSQSHNIFENDIPETNINEALNEFEKEKLQVLKEFNLKNKIDCIKNIEFDLNIQKEKCKELENYYHKNKPIIDKVFQEATFEQLVSDQYKVIDDLQSQKGEITNSIHMYTNFLKSFKTDKPSCPLCFRDIQEKSQSNCIAVEIEKKISYYPNIVAEIETKLTAELAKQREILELKTTYFKVKHIENEQLPVLSNLITERENQYEKQNEILKKIKNSSNAIERDLDLVKNIKPFALLIDKNKMEIEKLQNEIKDLQMQIPDTQNSRDIQDLYSEKDNLEQLAKDARKKIKSLTYKQNMHNEELHSIREEINNLKLKELYIEQNTLVKEQMEKVDSQIINHDKYILEAEYNVNFLKQKIDSSLQSQNHTENVYRKNITKLIELSRDLEQALILIKTLDNDIIKTKERNIIGEIHKTLALIKTYEEQLNDCSNTKKEISERIKDLENQLENQNGYLQQLKRNQNLHVLRNSLEAIEEQCDVLRNKIDDKNSITLFTELPDIEKQITVANTELNQQKGIKLELEKTIEEIEKELFKPEYANAMKCYQEKYVEYQVLEKSIKDLEICIKVIDSTIIHFHEQQMQNVNEIIRDFWRTIYKGNDIDYIEIKSEISPRSSDKRRLYDYRLVQVKNDVEIDMRDRCSAGQKVLASLIIRIALADTFSVKCGVLALDEPTTNLDKENIDSLCDSLCNLIDKKKNQGSFQLLIITHNEEFIEKLSRKILIENYIHVSRNKNGKSITAIKPTKF